MKLSKIPVRLRPPLIGGPSPDMLGTRFKAVAQENSYELLPSFPLATRDPTLLLINATMAPFKCDMTAGLPITPPIAIVQRCFRNQGAPKYLYAFDMLGMLANAEELPRVSSDIVRFLTGEAELPATRLHCVADADDNGLWDAMKAHFPVERLHAQRGNVGAFHTRWQFGVGSKLSGRGLTIAYDPATPPRSGHLHGWASLLPLGNIIVIERDEGGQSYVEVGFGAEVVAAAPHHGNMREIAPHAAMLHALGYLAGPTGSASAMEVVKCLIGAASLAEHGVRPGPRGSSYVMRKLLRGMAATLLDAGVAPADLVARFDCIQANLSAVWPRQAVSEAGWEALRTHVPAELRSVTQLVARLDTESVKKVIANYWQANGTEKTVKFIQSSHGVPAKTAHNFVESNFASR